MPELLFPCSILRAIRIQQGSKKSGQLSLRRKLGVFRETDERGVLIPCLSRLVPLAVERKEIRLYPLLKACVKVRFEYIAEDLPAILCVRQQELSELALRDHGDLAELRAVYAEDISDRRIYIRPARDNAPVRHSKFGARRLLCGSAAAGLGPLILRVSPDGISFPCVGKGELHLGRRLWRSEFGAEHGAFAPIAAWRAEKREGDGVKERCFPCAGVAGDEIQAPPAEPPEIELRFIRVGAKGAERQMKRSHGVSSSRSAAKTAFA